LSSHHMIVIIVIVVSIVAAIVIPVFVSSYHLHRVFMSHHPRHHRIIV
jgi:uncharacterized protein YneF (UPF0154 family)